MAQGGIRMRRCTLHVRRQLGGILALGGVMLVFVCLPVEILVIVLGIGMTAIGIVLLEI